MILKQSQLFTKTLREAPAGEEAANAILLERGGFIVKNSAGVYTFLPLGWLGFYGTKLVRQQRFIMERLWLYWPF